jgi:hypothetical protein
MNRALNQIPTRAEKRKGAQLHETFVDSGIADVLTGSITRSFMAAAPRGGQTRWHILHRSVPCGVTSPSLSISARSVPRMACWIRPRPPLRIAPRAVLV